MVANLKMKIEKKQIHLNLFHNFDVIDFFLQLIGKFEIIQAIIFYCKNEHSQPKWSIIISWSLLLYKDIFQQLTFTIHTWILLQFNAFSQSIIHD